MSNAPLPATNQHATKEHPLMSSSEIHNATGSDTTTIRISHGQDFVSEFIYALTDLLDWDPEELPPLQQAVDTDAMEALFSPPENSTERFTGTLSFPFETVTVYIDAQPHAAASVDQQVVQISVTHQ